MSVVDFNAALRARVNQMADEQMQFAENLLYVPPSQVDAYLQMINAHAKKLSRLASRIDETEPSPFPLPEGEGEGGDGVGGE